MKSTFKKTLIMIQLFIVFQILNLSYGILNKKSLRIDKHLINKIRMLTDDSTSDENTEDDTVDDSSSVDISNEEINGTSSDSTNYGNSTIPGSKKSSSSGLSTGAICAIAIPCVAALIGVAAVAALCKGSAAAPQVPIQTLPPPSNYIDTSLDKFNAVQEIPQQPVQLVQPEPQPQVVEVNQPQPQLIRPNYPINTKLDPPTVNRAFQPMFPTQQIGGQMNMVPVQKVEMVPVTHVEMVPIQEVVPVNQVGAMQQAVPIQQVTNIHQGVESVPQISQVSAVPEIQTMPEIHNFGSGMVSQPQIIQSGIQQVPGKIIQGSEILPGQSFP